MHWTFGGHLYQFQVKAEQTLKSEDAQILVQLRFGYLHGWKFQNLFREMITSLFFVWVLHLPWNLDWYYNFCWCIIIPIILSYISLNTEFTYSWKTLSRYFMFTFPFFLYKSYISLLSLFLFMYLDILFFPLSSENWKLTCFWQVLFYSYSEDRTLLLNIPTFHR